MTISAMAKIWRNRIVAGTQLFEKCPARYKEQVEYLLRQDVENGVITAEEFEELTGIPYEVEEEETEGEAVAE